MAFQRKQLKKIEQEYLEQREIEKKRIQQEKELSEKDYKDLILDHYTFLKRPVLVLDDQIFVGNSKKVVQAAKEALHS